MQPTTTSLSYGLVAISVLTSIAASYAAFNLAERVAISKGKTFLAWLISGALAMGLGIWSMHYLGMLAVRLPIPVYYHVPTVVLSLLLAVLASVNVLIVVSRPKLETWQIAIGSVIMGSGVGAMHYTGMHAMRCSEMHSYQPALVTLSVIVAVAFSWVALSIAFRVRTHGGHREVVRIGGATVMGTGIAAMHYTAMAAVTFWPEPMPFSTEHTVQINTIGIAAVAITAAFVLLGALATTVVDRAFYEQLRRERDSFHSVAECSLDCLYLCEAVRDAGKEIQDFVFTYVNSNVEKASALHLSVARGGRMCEAMPIVKKLGHFDLYKKVVATGDPLITEFSLLDTDRKTAWLRIQAVKLRDGLVISASDITARKRDEEHIRYLAHHDPLTGLVNRSLLLDRINQALERAVRYSSMFGVFLIDVDGFKQINDGYGHAAGDSILIGIATRLKSAVRAIDSVIRIGGDEFVVVMPEMESCHDIELCGSKFVDAFQAPFWVDGHCLQVTCSIGAVAYPDSALTPAELLAGADTAMYTAKRGGKNQFEMLGQGFGSRPPEDALAPEEVREVHQL